jgi:hypothetical protein
MGKKSCFVVMPIGEQVLADRTVSATALKKNYDDLIREALLRAAPDMEVVRADDVSLPGVISSDILARLMHSDLVIADVTYPNPNVFYELGIRHACRCGTIIIRDKAGPKMPFDISHLRCIEYENSPTGLKDLASTLQKYMEALSVDPGRPDNQLQELAKLTTYSFPNYAKGDDADPVTSAFMAVIQSPVLREAFTKESSGQSVDPSELMAALAKDPKAATVLLGALSRAGHIGLGNKPTPPRPSAPHPSTRGSRHKKGRRR